MKINVKHQDTLIPDLITVQVLDDGGGVMYCNHDGYREELRVFGNFMFEDWQWTMVCDKCNAWYNDLTERWQED